MSFTYQGKQVRKSTETEDKKLAQRIYDKIRCEVTEGKWFERLPGADKTFREMMEKYMAEHSEPKKASAERDRSSSTHLLPFFGGFLLGDITQRLINEYKTSRRVEEASPCTINRELALMKHAFNISLREWEWVNQNPVLKVAMEKEPPSRDRWLKYEEEEKLLAASSQWLQEIVIFALETGCRREEMLSLDRGSVDLLKKVAVVFGKKTGDRRTIPLTQKAFKAALKKAKIEGFRFHDLRHSFASRLAQSGVDPYAIQRLLGHKTFTTTQRYAHHCSESLRVGIKALEASRTEWGKNSSTNLAHSA